MNWKQERMMIISFCFIITGLLWVFELFRVNKYFRPIYTVCLEYGMSWQVCLKVPEENR